uniref:Protein-serine O-palmitoleoyltransferase porcupine-like n=1 Tax=Gouania willdenowi TaxID=441366 RepID=A0A8C5HCW0_GOUWI
MDISIRIGIWLELAESCGLSVIQQGLQQIWRLLLLCLICRVSFRLDVPSTLKHGVSVLTGICGLFLFFELDMVWVLLLAGLCYFILLLSQNPSRRGLYLSVVILSYLLIGELLLVDMVTWHKIRGSQMVVAMKAISVAFDVDRGAVGRLPSLPEYLGYVLFVGTVVFGPWISFSTYMNASSFYSVKKSQLCLLVSSCIAPYLFPLFVPIQGNQFTQKWQRAYENALSFHFSNYFVGHLSESTTMLAGAGFSEEKDNILWDLKVVEPLNVEMPRSMVQVVTSWNIPMSQWLKTYVFKNAMKLGTFPAILVTYTASALLHGLSFHLGAVLLSLGFITYVEHVLRKKLSAIFNACILSRPCTSDCSHRHKKVFHCCSKPHCSIFSWSLYSTWSGFKGFKLSYTAIHTIQRWSELNWASHWIVFLCWLLFLIL